jgi:hypothetical protein
MLEDYDEITLIGDASPGGVFLCEFANLECQKAKILKKLTTAVHQRGAV